MAEKVGRPLKFKSVEELQKKIDLYFESCYEVDDNGRKILIRPLTITGLALALDTDRQTLLNYEAREEYFDTIKSAKMKIENWTEEQLFTNKHTAGVIFNMTNNYGWVNKQETKQDVTINTKLEDFF